MHTSKHFLNLNLFRNNFFYFLLKFVDPKNNILKRLVLFLLTINICYAQNEKCASHLRLINYLEKNEETKKYRLNLEKETKKFKLSKASNINIPVVVHIVHKNANENISNSQIESQINVLNDDFTRMNNNANNTPFDFLPIISNLQINFCLATIDPNGNPTNGIIRKQTVANDFTSYGNEICYDSLGGSNAWNTKKYLNIWVCDIESGVLGWGQYPAGGDINTDGVVIDFTAFGTNGTATHPYNLGRTSTHEIGHWFNLLHLWGDQICGDDLVNDTPEQEEANYGCKIHPHPSCTNNGDMFMNFMDYTNDACMNSFTQGQKNRVWAAIYNYRNELLNSNGCTNDTLMDNDAGVLKIIQPNNENENCATPIIPRIVLKNFGNSTLHSADIKYNINGGNEIFYNWNGSLNTNETDTFSLPPLTSNGTNHLLIISSLLPNGMPDINTSNDQKTIFFSSINGKNIKLDIMTDNYGHETSWMLLNENNNLIDSAHNLMSNKLYELSYCLNFGCYKFIINDSYGDGFCCNFGNGMYEIAEWPYLNSIVYGNQFLYTDTTHFCITPTKTNYIESESFNIFPNPSQGNIFIKNNKTLNNTPIFANIYNHLGQLIYAEEIDNEMIKLENKINDGIYQLLIYNNNFIYSKKIILQKN